ncbi:MAG TPA: hypothetical protein VHV79_00675 [Mycobacteriales bacterium]|jgi:hypothetical protein|nr:hypothetical protein [Mycobacteriales bacterium]
MATPARAGKSAAIAASPVWADSGSSSSPASSGDQASADSATVAALQTQIVQL